MEYLLHIIIMISIYSILCLGANLLSGLLGKMSLAFAAFYGVGAYITALCILYFHWNLFLSLLAIIVFNTLLSLIIALPSLRLKGDYFVLATLGFQIIVYNVLITGLPLHEDLLVFRGSPSQKLSVLLGYRTPLTISFFRSYLLF